MAYYNRKATRIPGYDYSTENYYFVTVCTYGKMCIFGQPEQLNEAEIIAQNCIKHISDVFHSVQVDHYVVMPNHIHCILALEGSDQGAIHPTVSKYKSLATIIP